MGRLYNHYILSVRDQKSLGASSNDGVISSDVMVFIYGAGTKTLSTIYSDAAGSSKTNPMTRAAFATAGGKIEFYSSASSHDIYLAHSDGSCARYASVTPTMHTLPLDRDGLDKCIVFPAVFNAGGTETDTGLDLPLNSIVKDVVLEVVTSDSSETCAIGLLSSETNGDADGLMVATDVGTVGLYTGAAVTVGSNETYVSATRYGALIGLGKVGTDAANDCGFIGGVGHVVSGANAVSISYTPSSSDTFAGYGYVYFRHVR
jgi:hypothetical protein